MRDFYNDFFVQFGGRVFQQYVAFPMGTYCAPILTDLFLYSYKGEFTQSLPMGTIFAHLLADFFMYEAEFTQRLLRSIKKISHVALFCFRYIKAVLLLNNPRFGEHLVLGVERKVTINVLRSSILLQR